MAYQDILLEKSDQIAILTLNRPARLNAYTSHMLQEIMHAHAEIEADPKLRVTIMTAAGRVFCAGADLERGGNTFERGNPGGI
ncbi:MAG: enoyl-CoA hydratase/isomerase family protein [Deltaproteobacteria bacterium]|nr:enoyl-CoA hydratase/isomerase family protein [Deltaproteobacteria bacterium]